MGEMIEVVLLDLGGVMLRLNDPLGTLCSASRTSIALIRCPGVFQALRFSAAVPARLE